MLIADTHLGFGNDSRHLLNNQTKFFDEILFPYIDKYEIKHAIHLGDVFDRRKYVNFVTAKTAKEKFFQPMYDRGVEMHITLGNHDVFYKHTNSVNSLTELYGESKFMENIRIYENPETVNIGGTDILMVPWICAENEGISYEAIKKSTASIACGHLELANFPMYRNSISDHGMDHRIFNSFDFVFSGHFHHKSTTHNIWYVGSTAQYTWSDFGDSRGIHILDTETKEVEFISNDFTMYNKYIYDDVDKTPEKMMNFDANQFAGTYVKMVVKNKTNPLLLEKMIDKFEKADIISLQVVEEVSMYGLDIEVTEEMVDESEDTLSIILKAVTGIEDPAMQSDARKMISEIYQEAMTR